MKRTWAAKYYGNDHTTGQNEVYCYGWTKYLTNKTPWRCHPFPLHESFFKTGSKAPSKLKILEVKKPPKWQQRESPEEPLGLPNSFKLHPPQDASKRTQTSPARRPPLPKTPAQPGTSLQAGRDISAASTTSSATLAHKESASTRGGKGKGQCVPPRPSPPEPSEANANSEIPPLKRQIGVQPPRPFKIVSRLALRPDAGRFRGADSKSGELMKQLLVSF